VRDGFFGEHEVFDAENVVDVDSFLGGEEDFVEVSGGEGEGEVGFVGVYHEDFVYFKFLEFLDERSGVSKVCFFNVFVVFDGGFFFESGYKIEIIDYNDTVLSKFCGECTTECNFFLFFYSYQETNL